MQFPEIKQNLNGWGNYPKVKSIFRPFYSVEKFNFDDTSIIPRGLGRSYGDSALNEIVVDMTRLDRFISFDETNGTLHCQSGISLHKVLSVVVDRGWFLPVTPGTKNVTLGGAIACDVHGKNHHIDGSFCDYIISMNVLTGSGEIFLCSHEMNSDLFYATCGGMGLTGIIIDACIHLKPIQGEKINALKIKADNIDEALQIFDEYKSATYSVAWIDCLKKGENMGRSIVFIGEHDDSINFRSNQHRSTNVPFYFPSFILNKSSIQLFNSLFYNIQSNKLNKKTMHYDEFFYPLDSINNWNRLYGKNGFFQYQFVVPFSVGVNGLKIILEKITNSKLGSFLAVLKTFGKGNNNILSFPIEGYTLSIDFKYHKDAFQLFNYLDNMIIDMMGKIYLAKDARMSANTFKSTYLNWEKFQEIRAKYCAINTFSSFQSKRIGLD